MNVEVSFICEYCGNKYLNKKGLRKHQRISHPDEIPVSCAETEKHINKCPFENCVEPFVNYNNLVSHISDLI